MFGRKNKNPPEQGRTTGRQMQRGGAVNPAFSYYTNRAVTDAPRERTQQRQQVAETEQGGTRRRTLASALPFWLLVGLAIICVLKVLWLSTNPKINVVGKTSVSATYLRSTAVYAAATHHLLASSITSHSKVTADLDGTARSLKAQFPELENVMVSIPLVSNRPVVYIEIAQPSLIVQTTHGNYALNKAGVALARVQSVPAHVPVLVDQSGGAPQPGRQYLPSSTVAFMQTVAYQFTAAQKAINTFILPSNSPYELDMRLANSAYVIRYNLEEDATTESGAALATIEHLGGAAPTSYLDVRVPGRAYYK